MSTNLNINGVNYPYPDEGDSEWAVPASQWAAAVTSGVLQKAGGAFTLLADVNFGPTYGLVSTYYKSRSSNIADAGQLRLARADVIAFRNEANDGNLSLGMNSSNRLTFETVALTTISSTDILTNKSIDAATNTLTGITNSSISDSAAIAYSKLNLASSIVNADISNSAAIAYSKLALTGSIVNADVNASAAIAGTKIDATFGNQTVSTTAAFQASEVATPATPSVSTRKLYPKADGWYDLDSTGVEAKIGTGGSGGSIDYISNGQALSNTTGWTTYADAAGSVPVDGTGGSPNVLFTRNTSSPLRPPADFKLAKDAANRQGEGVSYDFTIDSADVNKSIQISCDFNFDGSYVAGDVACYIYDVTNAQLIYTASPNLAAGKYTYQTTFVATDSTSYRLIFHVATTNASAWNIYLDNVSVGPELAALGVPVEGPKDVSSLLTFTSFGTVSDVAIYMERTASKVRFFGTFRAGTVTAAVPYIDFSALGISVDSTKYVSSQSDFGYLTRIKQNATAANLWENSPRAFWITGNNQRVTFGRQSENGAIIQINSAGLSNSDYATLDFTFEVAEWAGSAAYLNQAVPEYLANNNAGVTAATDYDTGFVYGPNGTPVLSVDGSGSGGQRTRYRCRSLTPIQDTDDLKLQLNDGNGWFNAENSPFSSQLIANFYYGMGIQRISGSTTDFYVTFGNRGADQTGATLNAAGSAWSTLSAYRWRVVKIPGQVQATTFSLPAQMTNEQATAMGFKTYLHGTTYNGGNAPTVSGTNWTTTRAAFIPYQMQDGSWRCRFNVKGNISSAVSSFTGTIAGITFKNDTVFRQALSAYVQGSGTDRSDVSRPVVNENASTFQVITGGSTFDLLSISGDVELESKPTWAY